MVKLGLGLGRARLWPATVARAYLFDVTFSERCFRVTLAVHLCISMRSLRLLGTTSARNVYTPRGDKWVANWCRCANRECQLVALCIRQHGHVARVACMRSAHSPDSARGPAVVNLHMRRPRVGKRAASLGTENLACKTAGQASCKRRKHLAPAPRRFKMNDKFSEGASLRALSDRQPQAGRSRRPCWLASQSREAGRAHQVRGHRQGALLENGSAGRGPSCARCRGGRQERRAEARSRSASECSTCSGLGCEGRQERRSLTSSPSPLRGTSAGNRAVQRARSWPRWRQCRPRRRPRQRRRRQAWECLYQWQRPLRRRVWTTR